MVTREAIESAQLAQLRVLLDTVAAGNLFYQRKLGSAALPDSITSLGAFSAQVPFTTKQELVQSQAAHPPFGTNLSFPLDRYTRFHQTSGTSGTPMRWLDTPESWKRMIEDWKRIYAAAGVSARDRVFFAFSFGPFLGFWMAFEAAEQIGCLCLPGGGLSSVARLRIILDNQATALCCTPTYAIRLGQVAQEENFDLRDARVRRIVVAGEPGGSIPNTRRRIEGLWPGARVFDHHGMTEVGPVTYECPAKAGVLHVMEGSFFTEIIDPRTGVAVPAGQPGELVLTTLGRLGSPLLRYRTGDWVKTVTDSQPCACGSCERALEGGILGRVDDMIVVRGVNVFPGAVEDIVRSVPNIAEYRVRVTQANSLTRLEIEIEPNPECAHPNDLANALEKSLQTAFSLRVPVIVLPTGTLPRFEMKARRWLKD